MEAVLSPSSAYSYLAGGIGDDFGFWFSLVAAKDGCIHLQLEVDWQEKPARIILSNNGTWRFQVEVPAFAKDKEL